jgi:hypothetical protein
MPQNHHLHHHGKAMAFIKAFFFFSLEDCFFEEEDEPIGETLEGATSI